MTKYSKSERETALERLRERLKPGDTVYTILRHVSRSGMLREISAVVIRGGHILNLSHTAAPACGLRIGKRGGLVVGGCGMDMGFHLVYSLSSAIFPDGFNCIGEKCPSNDHVNGDRNYNPDHRHGDGGYALNWKWCAFYASEFTQTEVNTLP